MPELDTKRSQESKAEERVSALSQWMKSDWMKKQIERLLPGGDMNSDRIWAISSRQLNATPELAFCTIPSVIGGILESATLGLTMGTNGEAWLIPFKNYKKELNRKVWEAQLVIGYRGHLALAWRSEKIKSVSYDIVMNGDSFDYQKGSAKFLHHKPREDRNVGAAPDGMRFAWFQIETIWDGVIFDVYNKNDVERVRAVSAAKDSPAWKNWYRDMAIKTVANNVMKFAPQTAEISRAVSLGDQESGGIGQVFDVDIDFDAAPPILIEAERKRNDAQAMMDEANAGSADGANSKDTQGIQREPQREREKVPAQGSQSKGAPARETAAPTAAGGGDELGY